MYDLIYEFYLIKINSILEINKKVYRLKTNNGDYYLKYQENNQLETILERLELYNLPSFISVIKNKYQQYISYNKISYFYLMKAEDEDYFKPLDMKIDFYFQNIINLHKKSLFNLNNHDAYFEKSINYLNKKIKKLSLDLLSRIEVIEQNEYNPPNDYYFLEHYYLFYNALENAQKNLNNFEEHINEEKSFSLSLIYNNFSYAHILLKSKKIISLDKMNINLPIYDIYDFVSKNIYSNININTYIKNYFKETKLNNTYIDLLFALLYIFPYERKNNLKDDLISLINNVNYLNKLDDLYDNLITSEEDSE